MPLLFKSLLDLFYAVITSSEKLNEELGVKLKFGELRASTTDPVRDAVWDIVEHFGRVV